MQVGVVNRGCARKCEGVHFGVNGGVHGGVKGGVTGSVEHTFRAGDEEAELRIKTFAQHVHQKFLGDALADACTETSEVFFIGAVWLGRGCVFWGLSRLLGVGTPFAEVLF